MRKIKLFTHTDLDGIGCYIVLKTLLPEDIYDIEVEYCDYDNINEKVMNFIESEDLENYDQILISDISVDKDVAIIINNNKYRDKFELLDHHPTAIFLNNYNWAQVTPLDADGNKTCGTEIMYNYIGKQYGLGFYDISFNYFVRLVTLYDTWRWKEDFDMVTAKNLNSLLYIMGRDRFIDVMLNSNFDITKYDWLIEIENEKIDRLFKLKLEQLYIRDITDARGRNLKVGVVSLDRNQSEIGNRLCEELSDKIDFVAMIDTGSSTVSLRSIKPTEYLDLGKDIAILHYGGGHPQASGCKLTQTWYDMIKFHFNPSYKRGGETI